MEHSTAKKRNNQNKRPLFTEKFIYQEQLTIEKYNKLIQKDEGASLRYSEFINFNKWTNFIQNPFDSDARQKYLDHISPATKSKTHT